MSGHLAQERMRAMGTECLLVVATGRSAEPSAGRALAAARTEVRRCERELSRFVPDSDLSRLNCAAGAWTQVGERLVGVLTAALRARELTAGRFDPTILPALRAAGYDRSFDDLVPRPPRSVPEWRANATCEIDATRGLVRLEPGAEIDLGGIGKGWSAMRATAAMHDAAPGLIGGLADLGGDVALRGQPPAGDHWVIGVEDPRNPGELLGTLAVRGGGVATSGRNRRRFGPGRGLHHLIDPSTGRPADSGPLAVTVVGPSAAEAEAHATLLAMATPDAAARHVRAHRGISAILVAVNGERLLLGDPPFASASAARLAGAR
jgi:FAD:protein FMN transferase